MKTQCKYLTRNATAKYDDNTNQLVINQKCIRNGTASANPTTAAAGTEITLTATPNSGYRFKEWQVVSGGVTVVNNKFTMPAQAVAVKAVFELIPPTTYNVTVQNDGKAVIFNQGVLVGGRGDFHV